MRKRRLKAPPQKRTRSYLQIWRVIDGAIGMAFVAHPEYLAPRGILRDNARRSIAKRVTGAILGYAEQSARVRSGASPAHARGGVLDKSAALPAFADNAGRLASSLVAQAREDGSVAASLVLAHLGLGI